jgi:hypothetical protein
MRVVVISPDSTEDNSFTNAVRTELQQEANRLNFSFIEMKGSVSAVTDNNIVVLYDNIKNSVLRDIWIGFQLPSILRKLKPDVIIHLTGIYISKISAKQVHAVSSSFFEKRKNIFRWGRSAFSNRNKILTANNHFIVSSDKIEKLLVEDYSIEAKSIKQFSSSNNVSPIDWEKREAIKQEITEGAEFFFSDARFAVKEEVLNLLKAFSVFKKWQQSSMRLIIQMNHANLLGSELSNYKYRNDVVVTQTDEALPAGYVVVQPYADVNSAFIATASLFNAATITVPSSDLPSNQSELFLTVENQVEHVGQALIALYKNEQRRNNLANAASVHYKNLSNGSIFPHLHSFQS